MTSPDSPVAPKTAPGTRRAAMPFIMACALLDMTGIGLIIPVLPPFIGRFTTSPEAHAFWFGMVAFAFGVANFLAAPVLGALSDRFGRRPVLLLGFAGFAFSFFATPLAQSLTALIIIRLIAGALQANMAVAQAYVADITPPAERAKRFGMLGAMFGVGFILGPALGGTLGHHDLRWPFFLAGSLALINVLYGFFVLPESLSAERRSPLSLARLNPFASLLGPGRLHGVGLLAWVAALTALGQFLMHMSWVLYTQFKFGWGPRENGLSLFLVGLLSVLVQGGLLRVALKRWSAQRIAILGMFSSALTYALWGFAWQGWMMLAILPLNLFGYMTVAAIQSLVSNAAGEGTQGRALGALAAINSFAAALAPVLTGWLLSWAAATPEHPWHLGAPLFFGAALQLSAALLALWHFRRVRHGGGHDSSPSIRATAS